MSRVCDSFMFLWWTCGRGAIVLQRAGRTKTCICTINCGLLSNGRQFITRDVDGHTQGHIDLGLSSSEAPGVRESWPEWEISRTSGSEELCSERRRPRAPQLGLAKALLKNKLAYSADAEHRTCIVPVPQNSSLNSSSCSAAMKWPKSQRDSITDATAIRKGT